MSVNFDPNFTMCGRVAEYHVKLVFGLWEQRTERTVTFTSNIKGLDVIKFAVDKLYEELPSDEHGFAMIEIGDIECVDDSDLGEDWLGEKLISAEIVSIKPTSKTVFGIMASMAGDGASGDAAA